LDWIHLVNIQIPAGEQGKIEKMTKSEKWQIRIILICGLYFIIRCFTGCSTTCLTSEAKYHQPGSGYVVGADKDWLFKCEFSDIQIQTESCKKNKGRCILE